MYEEEIHFWKLLLKQSETGTFETNDPKINKVHLLHRMNVWTKFEEGRLRHSRVINRKQKGYRGRTDRQTDQPTCAKQLCPSSSKGGKKKVFPNA